MAELGGGGTYGGSRWNGVSMIDMWLAVSNQETEPHWQLLTGWRKSYELTLQHMMTVKGYRENLAAAWPPEKSPASAAYIQRLDELIANLQQTYDAAVANHSAFSSATLALSSARRDLDKVVTEYVSNEGKLAAFEEEQAAVQPKGALARPPEAKPPVAAARQEQLMVQARRIMNGLSSELIQARTQIMQPEKYHPARQANGTEYDYRGDAYAAPSVPPVVPFNVATSSPSPSAISTSHPESVGSPSLGTIPTSSRQPGVVLGGVESSISAPSPHGISASPVHTGHTTPHQGSMPGFAPLIPAVRSSVRQSSPTGGAALTTPSPLGAIRAMPPPGTIGTVPAPGMQHRGQSGRTPQGVNTFGAVINPTATHVSQSQAAAARSPVPISQPFGSVGARTHHEPESPEPATKRDPENPWSTAVGVDPVLRPTPLQYIDPGPAIGLT